MEYRPLPDTDAHDAAFLDVVRYAFGAERGPDFDDDPAEHPATFHRRGLYDVDPETADEDLPADALRATCGWYDFTLRLRSDWHRVAGLSAVASPPEERRTGNAAAMLDAYHRELRREGVAWALLWPFEYPFYRRFGYAVTNESAVLELAPSDLAPLAADGGGSFRRLSGDDHEAMRAVHESAADHALAMRRTEGWVRHRLLTSWDGDRYASGWFDGDDLRGYVVYSVTKTDGDRVLDVHDFVALDGAARRQLFRFCHNHDSQTDRVRLYDRVDTRTLFELADPRAAEYTVRPGPMLRAVDLAAAVESLSYPGEAEGTVRLAVEDRYPWNEETVEVRVEDGRATCGPADGDPDVTGGVGPVSLLVAGARDVSFLRATTDLTTDDETAALLSELFPPVETYLREGF